MHNFERRVVGLICILRLICWVVSCGNSLLFHSLTLFCSALSHLPPLLFVQLSSSFLPSFFHCLCAYIPPILCALVNFNVFLLQMLFVFFANHHLSFFIAFICLLFYIQFYTFFAIANIEVNSFFRRILKLVYKQISHSEKS